MAPEPQTVSLFDSEKIFFTQLKLMFGCLNALIHPSEATQKMKDVA